MRATSSMKDIADALVALGGSNDGNNEDAVNEEIQGDEYLVETKKRLADDGFPAWSQDLEMERRNTRPYFRHPRLPGFPNRWYSRYLSSGGHTGLLEAIQEAEGVGTSSRAAAPAARGPPPPPPPARPNALEEEERAPLTESQVRACVRSVLLLLNHFQAIQEQMRRLMENIDHNEGGIAEIERQLKNLKRKRS